MSSYLSRSDVPAALAARPHRAAFVVLAVTDPGRLAAVRADDLHVAGVHSRLLRDDAAGLRAALGRRHLGVLLHPVDAFDQHAAGLGQRQQHLAAGAAVLAAAHDDGVALLHEQLRHCLQHLRRQRDDLHEPLLPQLAAHRAEDAGAAGVAAVTDEHGGVLVEADVGAVGAAPRLGRADDDGFDDVALLDARTGKRVLDSADDDVADAGVATAGSAEHPD